MGNHPRQAKDRNIQFHLYGDLGVIVSETLKPNRQCSKAAKKANPIMRAIKAAFIDIMSALFHKLYGSFIRPHLEYLFQAW